MEEKKLIPENDQQELWELQGRVYAAMEHIKAQTYPNRQVLIAMLGGDPKVIYGD